MLSMGVIVIIILMSDVLHFFGIQFMSIIVGNNHSNLCLLHKSCKFGYLNILCTSNAFKWFFFVHMFENQKDASL